jgi:hypothetical protein
VLSILIAAVLAVSPVDSDSSARCNQISSRATRPADPGVVIVRATRDSAFDGRYGGGGNGAQRIPSGAGGEAVYGQRVELLAVEGPDSTLLASAKRAVVIWWGITASCTRAAPFRAIRNFTGDLFMLARVRPSTEWVDSTPTFDMLSGGWTYSPDETQPGSNPSNAMSIAEYRPYFRLLPVRPGTQADTCGSWRNLIAWAAANPKLAAKYPASSVVRSLRDVVRDVCEH